MEPIQLFNEREIIRERMFFHHAERQESNPFNVTFGIDKNFLYGCGIAIASILLNNSEVKFHFHVFTDYFTEQDKEKFQKLAQENKSDISIYVINCDHLKNLPNSKNWTYATYFRFIIADYFTGKTERILYLDADIACKGSLKALQDLSFAEHEIAAVIEENGQDWWDRRAKQLDVPDLAKRYFNAGVLLINIPQWSENNISGKALAMLNDPAIVSKITHLDQDILNMLLVNHVQYIDVIYNTRFSLNYMLKKAPIIPIKPETVIVHYIGPTKPWHKWASYPCSQYFLDAKNASPWQHEPLLGAANIGQWRYAAKHYFKQSQWIAGSISYLTYFYKKITD